MAVKNDIDGIAREFAEGPLTIKAVYLGALKPNVSYPENTSDEPITFSGLLFAIIGKATFKFNDRVYEVERENAVPSLREQTEPA